MIVQIDEELASDIGALLFFTIERGDDHTFNKPRIEKLALDLLGAVRGEATNAQGRTTEETVVSAIIFQLVDKTSKAGGGCILASSEGAKEGPA